MSQLLVVGGASSDVLHLEDGTVSCVGGAGMYTAMACGGQKVDPSGFDSGIAKIPRLCW